MHPIFVVSALFWVISNLFRLDCERTAAHAGEPLFNRSGYIVCKLMPDFLSVEQNLCGLGYLIH